MVALVSAALVLTGASWGITVAATAADCDSSGGGNGGTGSCGGPESGGQDAETHVILFDKFNRDGTPVQGYGEASIRYLINWTGGPSSSPETDSTYDKMFPACTAALAVSDQAAVDFANSPKGRELGLDPNTVRGKSRVVAMWYAGWTGHPWGKGVETDDKVIKGFQTVINTVRNAHVPDSQAITRGWLSDPTYSSMQYKVDVDGLIANTTILDQHTNAPRSYADNLQLLANNVQLDGGVNNSAHCIALNQFQPPANVTYTVSGVTQQQGGFPVSGGTQSVSDRVTLSRQPAGDGEPVNATFTLNWDSADPNNDPDKTAKKTAQVTTNGTSNGPSRGGTEPARRHHARA